VGGVWGGGWGGAGLDGVIRTLTDIVFAQNSCRLWLREF